MGDEPGKRMTYRTSSGPGPNDTQQPPQKVQQPKPQALPRSSSSAIQVSSRQRGNPILGHIKIIPYEYADIPADYVLGTTTCALFLSLKYHRLHPEYIYSRIRLLGHKFNLRILLIMVDIENHEDSLKELSKTSVINNLTLMLCWSAPEAAHYLELFKSSEYAQPTAIRTQQAQSYKDALVEFVTAPRYINKSDAASLISTFGSLRDAVNAQPEQISGVPGWGERKVRQWSSAVTEDFKVEKAKGKSAPQRQQKAVGEGGGGMGGNKNVPLATNTNIASEGAHNDEEEAMLLAAAEAASRAERQGDSTKENTSSSKNGADGEMSEGITAALARLREGG